MVQLKAVENELAAVRREIMKDQVSHHLLAAKRENDTASIDALNELLKSWMK
jgi:DNA-binding FrmR family transcriptional regulator